MNMEKVKLPTTEELQQEFDFAKQGVDPVIVLDVIEGKAFIPAFERTYVVRNLRIAWSRLQAQIKHS